MKKKNRFEGKDQGPNVGSLSCCFNSLSLHNKSLKLRVLKQEEELSPVIRWCSTKQFLLKGLSLKWSQF